MNAALFGVISEQSVARKALSAMEGFHCKLGTAKETLQEIWRNCVRSSMTPVTNFNLKFNLIS